MANWSVTRGLIAWSLLSVAGIWIVLLPDDGRRIVTFSEGHGPSVQDSIGVAVLLIGWLAFLIPLIRDRSGIRHKTVLGAIALGASAVLVWSVATDQDPWWMVAAAVFVACQVYAGLSIVSHSRHAG